MEYKPAGFVINNDAELFDAYLDLRNLRNNLIILLFGDDYAERISPDMLTDEKLLEAVRMLKEVY